MAVSAQTGAAPAARVTADRATSAYRAGAEAAQAGDFARARQAFLEVVRLEPKIPEGHAALGAVLIQLGEAQAAVSELKRGLALKPDDAGMEANLALAEERAGDMASSLPLFRRVAERQPDAPLSADMEIGYAAALTATGHRPEAIARLQAALHADPENAVLHDGLGSLLAQDQQWNDARPEFERAVAIDASFLQARLHLAQVLMQLHEPAQATTVLQAAGGADAQNPALLSALALSYSAQGDYEHALPIAQAAMRAAPDNLEAALQTGIALQGMGHDREALPLFQRVTAAQPQNVSALVNEGLALVQQGNAKEAIPIYMRAAALTPDDPVVHEDLGVAYLQQSDLDDAVREFQEGLRRDGNNQQLHYNLGLAYKLKDDTARAVPELEQAARLDPQSPDPAYTLGILYMQSGRFDDATAQLRHTLELRPQNGDAWAVLGSVYKQQGKLPEAEDALRHAIALLPAQPGAHITLAGVLSEEGKKSEAAAERKQAADLTRVAVNRQRATFATNTGNMLLGKGQVADAIERFQEAIAADPSFAEAHTGLASALTRQGRATEAAEERQKANALDQGQH